MKYVNGSGRLEHRGKKSGMFYRESVKNVRTLPVDCKLRFTERQHGYIVLNKSFEMIIFSKRQDGRQSICRLATLENGGGLRFDYGAREGAGL